MVPGVSFRVLSIPATKELGVSMDELARRGPFDTSLLVSRGDHSGNEWGPLFSCSAVPEPWGGKASLPSEGRLIDD